MTDRVLDFSQTGAFLRVSLEQLVIKLEGREDEVTVPLADIAVVVVSHPQVCISAFAVSALSERGVSIVFCNRKMLPVGMSLPLSGHSLQQRRMAAQSAMSLPARKQLWRQFVVAKITAQAHLLSEVTGGDAGLAAIARTVKSGDTSNIEARAARLYWSRIFGDPSFRRRQDGSGANILLNYGYAVLRAQAARALCASGLHPSLGIPHSNQYDTFCLADDVMEPFRPLVDRHVVSIIGENPSAEIRDKAVKAELLSGLAERYASAGESRTLMDWLFRLASSLAAVIENGSGSLELSRLELPHARKGPVRVPCDVAHRDVRSAG